MLFIPIGQPLLLPAATGEKGAYILFRAKRDYVHKLSDTDISGGRISSRRTASQSCTGHVSMPFSG